jgi:Tol biopolymer transport system component
MKKPVVITAIAVLLAAGAVAEEKTLPRSHSPEEGETHFGELLMLTDGGENAEAYFSFDGKSLSLQSTHGDWGCDQIFTMPITGGEMKLVSTGKGRTTCAHWMPNGKSVVYSSTHHHDEACPPPADMSRGYVWSLYPTFDIFVVDTETGEHTQLTDEWGYDAEATISPAGDKIVFTSDRTGDLEIYTMDLDGSNVVQLTDELGYDGGPFFSPDGTKIVYRAHYPRDEESIADYKSLLADHKIRPSKLEVYVMDVDGSNKRQITDLDAATFAPYFHPSGEKIIFSTNYPDLGREFDLWMINLDGTGLTQVTNSPGFDGFPMWAPDGKTFVFASNRHNSKRGDTNVFITEWKD